MIITTSIKNPDIEIVEGVVCIQNIPSSIWHPNAAWELKKSGQNLVLTMPYNKNYKIIFEDLPNYILECIHTEGLLMMSLICPNSGDYCGLHAIVLIE